jgi:hypothetical protein
MAKLQQHTLSGDLLMAANELAEIKIQQGSGSMGYRSALKRVARLWSVLRMTRSHDEFLREVSAG